MKSARIALTLLVLGLLGMAAPVATASAAPTPAVERFASQLDSAGVHPDSTMAKADSTAAHAAGAAAAPAVAAPAAQTPPPAATPPPAPAPAAAAAPTAASKSGPSKIYYGGTVTVSFGNTTRLGIFPMVGYKLTPKISGGAEFGYEYLSYGNNQTSHNYGGSVFGRFRMGRNLYATAEYQNINYEIFTTANSSKREWVPAMLLGGGYVKGLGKGTSVYGEVLFDVLQADNSPYKNWEPIVNVGVVVGF